MEKDKFLELLNGLVELASTKKGVLEMTDIDKALKGYELTTEDMEKIYQYLEEKKVDVLTVIDDVFVNDDIALYVVVVVPLSL